MGIEPTFRVFHRNTGFEVREAHQAPIRSHREGGWYACSGWGVKEIHRPGRVVTRGGFLRAGFCP
jgi:hypothetical protein